MATQISAKELIEKMSIELGRLQQLCRDNGIDPLPPKGINQTMKVTAEVKVFKTVGEAEDYQKNSFLKYKKN